MRDGYGFSAMPLVKRFARITSGTLAVSVWNGVSLRKHTRIGICSWRTSDVPDTIQSEE